MIAVLAGLLLAVALPRLQAAWHFLPVEAAIERYWITGDLPAERLGELQRRSRESVAIHPHPRYWEGLSLLYYLEALQPDQRLHHQRGAFENAIQAADASLRLAPVQPRLWMRRADALDWLAYLAEPALQALKMSVYTGRVEPMLALSRLRLGYARLGALDEEGRDLLRDQTLVAWHLRQGDVLRALRSGQLPISRLRYLLADTHPDLLAEIEQGLGPSR